MRILTVSLLVCAMMAGGDTCCWRCVQCTDNSCCWVCGPCTLAEDTSTNGTMPNVEDANSTHLVTRTSHSRATHCPQGWSKFGQRCFFLVTEKKSWAKTQQHCQTIGGNLASIHSAEEHNYIQQMTSEVTWIGGSACQEESAWFWIDGTQVDYNFWCPAQPDNTKEECCMQMNTGGGKCWDDVGCSSMLQSICVMSL